MYYSASRFCVGNDHRPETGRRAGRLPLPISHG